MKSFTAILFILIICMFAFHCENTSDPIAITYPLNGALFPPEIAPPEIRWTDSESTTQWKLVFNFENNIEPIAVMVDTLNWMPDSTVWEHIKKQSLEKTTTLTITRLIRRFGRNLEKGSQNITFMTSKDSVAAPVFFRELPIPIRYAAAHMQDIKWRLGNVASAKPPQTVLETLPSCANCHSFSQDGRTIGMDVDVQGDKSAYLITAFDEKTCLNQNSIMHWNQYFKNDIHKTSGLFSRISPDGHYVLSTVQERIFYLTGYDKAYSFLFFPVNGILAYLDRETDQILALPGADDPAFVQTSGVWSPDGETIVFARAKAYQSKEKKPYGVPIGFKEGAEILGGEKFLVPGQTGAKRFMYDLYKIPFNQGKGGTPVPVPGASGNNKSNYFPKISPDGKWLVFTQARSYMLANKGSELYISSMKGGPPRRMQCSIGNMNSWHSWSPNSRWIVFSGKYFSPHTELWLAHIDEEGNDSIPVLLSHFSAPGKAANIPEFVNISPEAVRHISVDGSMGM
ncbi:TolB family protein [bacterium]